MSNTQPVYGFAETLEYLDGLKSTVGRVDAAGIGLAYLRSMGFDIVHKTQAPVIRSVCPDDLKAARKALRLTNQRLADEAGVSIGAVIRAQTVGTSSRKHTVDLIVSALVRLGAGIPETRGIPEKLDPA